MAIISNEMVWRQFAIAIDSLGNALRDCPEELWEARLWGDEADQWVANGFSAFWYLGYHFAVETVEEARALTERDPAIQAGRLAMQLHPWYGSAALPLFTSIHERIASEDV